MAEKRIESTTATREDPQQHQQQKDMARQSRDTRRERALASTVLANPFSLLGRLAEQMTSVFDEVSGADRSRDRGLSGPLGWSPSIDVFHRGNELVVRADLPGMRPEDINVDVSDDAVTLSGERQDEHRDERNGVYRYERSYGSFYRTIPLPEGTIADQAKANFKNGVLEITIPAPPEQVSRGRRLEISRGEERAEQRESSPSSKPTSK